ncbi:MAG: hypothetical protein Q9188_000405 [Gyalolechia gomerana]
MSKASSPAPAPTTLFSSLNALVAGSSETEFTIPGIVLIHAPKSSFSACTTIGKPTTYFSITDISPDLTLLLRRAPTISKTDRHGNQKTVKAGIYLDRLPADIPRPKLIRVNTAGADVPAPVVATSATAAATRGREPGKKLMGATGEQTTKVEKGTEAPAGFAAAAERPKGFEIDMVPGAFVAVGGRGSRLKKRPARFDDGVVKVVEVKRRERSAGR